MTPEKPKLQRALASLERLRDETTTWKEAVREKLESLDFGRLAADVGPFLERPDELALLEKKAVLRLLR